MNKTTRFIYALVPIELATDPDITPNELRVYIALSSFQGTDPKCWPSQKQIMARSTLKDKCAVSRAISKLKKKGWVFSIRRGLGKSNIYYCKFYINGVEIKPEELKEDNNSELKEINNIELKENNNSEFMKNRNSYIEKTNRKDQSKRTIKEKPAFAQSDDCDSDCSKKIIPLNNKDNKQALRKFIHGWFRENNESYHASKKEIGAVENIMKRFPGIDEVRALLEKFKNIIETAKEPFWANKPLIPSQFLCSIDFVISFKSHSKRSRVPNNAEIAEIFDENKRLYEKLKGEANDF